MMFSNQVSTKDLFSYPIRESSETSCRLSQGNCDSRGDSSYLDSQPFPGSFSQPESPAKKMLQKYASMGSIFRTEGSSSSGHKSDFLQTQRSRSTDRDERDFLHSVMSIVSESSSAVRFALQSFRDSMEAKQGKSEENLSTSFKKLSDEIRNSCDKIIEAMDLHSKMNEELHQLDVEVTKRDAIIGGLEHQIKEYQNKEQQKIRDILKNCHMEQQNMLEDKLQKLLNVTSEQLKLYGEQMSWQSGKDTNHQDFQKEMYKEQQKNLKHFEEILLSELSGLQQGFSVKQSQLGNYYKQQLQEYQFQQNKTMENCMQTVLAEGLRQASRETGSLFCQQKQEIKNTCDRHKEELQHFLKSELAKQMLEYEKGVNNILSSLKESVSKEGGNGMEIQKCGTAENQNGKWQTIPLRSSFSKSIAGTDCSDTTSTTTYRYHDVQSITIKSPEFNIPSNSSGVPMKPSTSGLFSSPWNASALFNRSDIVKPSPVATVAPMVQQSTTTKAIDMSSMLASKKKTTAERGKQKKQGIVKPQSQPKGWSPRNKKVEECTVASTNRYPTRANRQRMKFNSSEETKANMRSNVSPGCPKLSYEQCQPGFHLGDNSSSRFQNKRASNSWDEDEPQWLKVARLERNGHLESRETPTMYEVKEVMKCRMNNRRTPNFMSEQLTSSRVQWSNVGNAQQSDFKDLLSTPSFSSFCDLEETSPGNGTFWDGKVKRKDSGKRQLYDLSYDTQVTDISQAIKQQLVRVKCSGN